MLYSTEKALKDYGDKILSDEKKKIEDAMENVRTALKTEDVQAIDKAVEEMTSASHKIAEEMYRQKTAQTQENSAPSKSEPEGGEVEAEYEVKDDKKMTIPKRSNFQNTNPNPKRLGFFYSPQPMVDFIN